MFTRKEWAESEHCRFEIDSILSTGKVPKENILEIRMKNDFILTERYPVLSDVSTFKCYESDFEFLMLIEQIEKFILKKIAKNELIRKDSDQKRFPNIYYSNNLGYKLNLSGWKIVSRQEKQTVNADIEGPQFLKEYRNLNIKANLLIGLAKTDRGIKSPTLKYVDNKIFNRTLRFAINYEHPEEQGLSDKQAFKNGYMWFLKEYDQKMRSNILGIHLFYFFEYANFAVTYYRNNKWIRKYSLVLQDPKTKLSIEFLFTFGVKGTFENFCECTPLMETVVQSIKEI